MNELRERLQHLADASAEGIELSRPRLTPKAPRRGWATPAFVGAAAVALVAIVTGAVIVARGDSDDDANVATDNGLVDFAPAGVVAVTYGYASEITTTPVDLTLRFVDAEGQVFAERSWDEAYDTPPGGRPGDLTVLGGLLQDVPAGDLSLEATLRSDGGPVSCTQPFTVATGDRLILQLQIDEPIEGGGPGCAPIETVDQWVNGRTSGPVGESYVGLPPLEADARADAEGLTTRVAAADGMSLATTSDLVCDRIDLMVFDDVVVAADLPRESMPDQCRDIPTGAAEPLGG